MKLEELNVDFQLDESGKGFYKGYHFFAFNNMEGFMYYPVLLFRFDTKVLPEQLKEIRKTNKLTRNISLVENQFMLIVQCFNLSGKYKEEKANDFIVLLDQMIAKFEELGLKDLATCVICRETKDEELKEHSLTGFPVLTHDSCFENYYQHQVEKINKNEGNTKSYPISILYTLLGAIVGALPALLILCLTGYLFSLVFALIPIAAAYGYKLGKAPKNKKASIIITSISVVVLILFNLLFIELICLLSPEKVTFAQVLTENLGGFILSFVFGLLGIGYTYRFISKDNNENKLDRMR